MRGRFVPGAALLLSVIVSTAVATRLAGIGDMPPHAAPYVLVSAFAFGLAFLGGRIARPPAAGELPRQEADTQLPRCRPARWVALVLAFYSLAATWLLQSKPAPSGFVIATWLVAMVAIPFAFPQSVLARRDRPAATRGTSAWALVVLVLVVGIAAGARLARLGELPPVLSGDEANQIMDGMGWLSGQSRSDPFGTGWYGTVRLGMIPAGIGALSSTQPIAGPRLPYALVGTLAVAALALAAGQVAGTWGAISCASFLAFAPHHVHFSRLASVMVPDSLIAAAAIVLLIETWRRGSPRLAAFAGVSSGLSLYGYAGGRVVPVVLFIALLRFLFARRWTRRRRTWLALAMAAGFAVAAGPNLRFAVRRFADWNSRFNQVSIFAKGWIAEETRRLGSPEKIVVNQLKAGTIGLLSSHDTTPWFTGHPIIGPPLLVGCAVGGAGWLLGRRKRLEALLIGLVIAGNLAGVILTVGAPAPQRPSSLVPMLAILAGATVAGLVSLIPEPPGRRFWRFAAGTLASGVALATGIRDYPFDVGHFSDYGGHHAAMAQSAAQLLTQPRFRGRKIHLHGAPFVHSSFPSFRYFLPLTTILDDDPSAPGFTIASFPPGIHVFSEELIPEGVKWRSQLELTHAIRLAHPSYPGRDVAYVFIVPGRE